MSNRIKTFSEFVNESKLVGNKNSPLNEYEARVSYSGIENLDPFTQGYIQCALWSTTNETEDDNDNGGGNSFYEDGFEPSDIAPDTFKQMVEDCRKFQEENRDDLSTNTNASQGGHDFWLDRNGHGAGFKDGHWGDLGDRLSAAATKYGVVDLMLGDDDKIHGYP